MGSTQPISGPDYEAVPENARTSESSSEPRQCPDVESFQKTPKQPSNLQKAIYGWWNLELASMGVAIVLFGLYLHILWKYNDKSVSKFSQSPLFYFFRNLQSAAAFIMTLLRCFMLYPVVSAMGQLKWHYFQRSSRQRVSDLQAFDAASRGISGSLQLIFSRNAFHTLSLGCVLILATLYLGSSTQNTITQGIRTDWRERDGQAELPFSNFYNVFNTGLRDDVNGKPRYLDVDAHMRASVLSGWAHFENLGSVQNDATSLPVTCPSGQCEWTNISTLAVGRSCVPANYSLNGDYFASSKEADISNRFQLNTTDGTEDKLARVLMKPSGTIPPNSHFSSWRNNKAVILHFAAIANYEKRQFEVVECVLFWQVWFIASATFNGSTLKLDEDVTNSVSKGTLSEDKDAPNGGNISISAHCNFIDDSRCDYRVGVKAHRGLQNALLPFLNGWYTIERDAEDDPFIKRDDTMTALFISSWVKAKNTGWEVEDRDGPPLFRTVSSYMKNVAIYITRNIRTEAPHEWKPGKEGIEVQYFRIYLEFALYPAIMLALSMFLFVSTIWRTRGQEAWKNSQLPLLYHGFAQPVHDQTGELVNLSFMEAASEEKRVVLKDDDDDLGLKLREDRPIDREPGSRAEQEE